MDDNIDIAIANELAMLDDNNANVVKETAHDDEEIDKYSKFIDEVEKKDVFTQVKTANDLLKTIDGDINKMTDKVKSIYNKKFPELPSIVTNISDYINTVYNIEKGDTSSITLSFLPSNVYMALTFMFSSAKIDALNDKDKEDIISQCEKIRRLYDIRNRMLHYVSKNMKKIAPNLTALVGSDIESKLVAATGGIEELAKTPSGNIMNIGNHYVNTSGFSSRLKLNNGYLSEVKEYKEASDKMKMKVLRRYANKAALAARADAFKIRNTEKEISSDESEEEEANVNYGNELKNNISGKIDKIENDKAPVLKKPLPRPDDKPRRKRGGKRTRSIKKRYELTEIRMLKNRMKFGVEGENEYRDTGEGFGMLKLGGEGGRLKVNPKMNKIVTKKQKLLDMKYNNISGLHSSVVMTPMNGIELINPDILNNKLEKTKDKYFNSSSGFSTVVKNRLEEI